MRRGVGTGSGSGGEYAAGEGGGSSGVARVPAMELLMMVEGGGASSERAVQERLGAEQGGVTACKQEPRQLDSLLPGTHFLSGCHQLGSSKSVESQSTLTYPAAAISWFSEQMNNSYTCNGFPYNNVSLSNSALYGNISVDASGDPSNSNALPLQIGSAPPNVNGNFYPHTVCQYSSENVLTLPSCTCCPPSSSCSYLNFFNIEHLDPMETKHQWVTTSDASENLSSSNSLLMLFPTSEKEDVCQGYIRNVNYNAFESRMLNVQSDLQISGQPMIYHSIEECDDEAKYIGLMTVLQKELSHSDVGSVGRIVLPKKEAEANLPPLYERNGMILYMEDMVLQTTWKFKYRFWPNNKSRMYIMESTGDFVRAHGLQPGDSFIIYRNTPSGEYIVRGKRGTKPPRLDVVDSHKNEHSPKKERIHQPLMVGKQRVARSQQCQDRSQNLKQIVDNAASMMEVDSFSMGSVYDSEKEIVVPSHSNFVSPEIDLESISFEGAMA